ncbi:U1 [Hyposoter didymator ichnovirus]|nr:U1 [Hyposoter didymator ichnovirus]
MLQADVQCMHMFCIHVMYTYIQTYEFSASRRQHQLLAAPGPGETSRKTWSMLALNPVDFSLTARSFLSLRSVLCLSRCISRQHRLERAAYPLFHVKRPSQQA